VNDLLSGAITMAYLTAGLFFLRFYRRTGDSLFAYFCVAFWIFAIQRAALTLTRENESEDTIFYVLRLVGFLVIIVGIWQKNRGKD
jgi:hypothetical protein